MADQVKVAARAMKAATANALSGSTIRLLPGGMGMSSESGIRQKSQMLRPAN